jgi:HYR domain
MLTKRVEANLARMTMVRRMTIVRRSGAVAVLVVLAATASVPLAASGNKAATGTLDLRASLSWKSPTTSNCPPGTPPLRSCFERTGEGLIRGLGRVTQSYTYLADSSSCPLGTVKILGYPARFAVAGKGEIYLAVAENPDCLTSDVAGRNAPQSFTITGGTDTYAGASGSGRVERFQGSSGPRDTGTDTWIGTLAVRGLVFDLTAPTISGARSKTVLAPKKASRVRVTFRVTAQDDVDGPLRASCRPASGSGFKVGRTTVRCSATDTSVNSARASFTVTVKRRR